MGKVLDVGCGARSHSLYLQNKMKLEVFGIEDSPGVIVTAHAKVLKNIIKQAENGDRIPPASNYYGELEYWISYDNKKIIFPVYISIFKN